MLRRNKNRPHQPSRNKLDKAIIAILDQATNVDSENAPAQLRSILLKDNPLWKLPERRVARYLKRHLKARQNPRAAEIDVDEDEATIYTTTSAVSVVKESAPSYSEEAEVTVKTKKENEKDNNIEEQNGAGVGVYSTMKDGKNVEETAEGRNMEGTETPQASESKSLMDTTINEEDGEDDDDEQGDEDGLHDNMENEKDVVHDAEKPSDDVGFVPTSGFEEVPEKYAKNDAYADDNDKTRSSDGIACFGEGCVIC